MVLASLVLSLALSADPVPLPPLPVPPDLPTEKLERWIARECLSELEADAVRQRTKQWVAAFRRYEAGVLLQSEPLMDAALAMPAGSEERRAAAMKVYDLYAAKVECQKDLVRRIRRLIRDRGVWPERPENEL